MEDHEVDVGHVLGAVCVVGLRLSEGKVFDIFVGWGAVVWVYFLRSGHGAGSSWGGHCWLWAVVSWAQSTL